MWLIVVRLSLLRMVKGVADLMCMCCEVVVVVLVAAVVVVVCTVCVDLLTLLWGVVVGVWCVVLLQWGCCIAIVVVFVVVSPGCDGFWLLCVGLFCFVDCCFVVVVLVEVVGVELVLDCVLPVV